MGSNSLWNRIWFFASEFLFGLSFCMPASNNLSFYSHQTIIKQSSENQALSLFIQNEMFFYLAQITPNFLHDLIILPKNERISPILVAGDTKIEGFCLNWEQNFFILWFTDLKIWWDFIEDFIPFIQHCVIVNQLTQNVSRGLLPYCLLSQLSSKKA